MEIFKSAHLDSKGCKMSYFTILGHILPNSYLINLYSALYVIISIFPFLCELYGKMENGKKWKMEKKMENLKMSDLDSKWSKMSFFTILGHILPNSYLIKLYTGIFTFPFSEKNGKWKKNGNFKKCSFRLKMV